MDIEKLKKLEGRRVELTFHDGHVVRCRLIDVDPDSPGREVIYDDLEVVAWGPVSPNALEPGAAAAASISDLATVSVLAD